MLGLSTLGLVHTLISLVAVAAGLLGLLRDGRISPSNTAGKVYIGLTVPTCLTALGIFHHGGFGPPHAVAILTLLVLVAVGAAHGGRFGRASRYVETLGLSATFLFHLIPAITETSTRLPQGHPLVANADAPELKAAYGVLLAGYVIVAVVQGLRLRGEAAVLASR